MARAGQMRHLSPEDIHLCKTPAGILQLLARLGYTIEQQAVPLRKEEVGFAPADAAAIRQLYLLAEQGGEGYDGAFLQVVLFELQEVALTRLRSLAANLLSRGGNYLLLATSDYQRLAFVNPRREGGRVSIAKLVIDTAHPTRHDLDVLEGLAVDGQDPEALYRAHCAAFDVEKVTDRFYRGYAALFQRVRQATRDFNRGVRELYDPDRLDTFVQRLLGRIMFLYFIQKKGWLAGDTRFLTNRHRATVRAGGNYYAEVLEPLFFDTLNRRRPQDQSPWGPIPYLNGGLFERDYGFQVYLSNELFDPGTDEGILGFFDGYSFPQLFARYLPQPGNTDNDIAPQPSVSHRSSGRCQAHWSDAAKPVTVIVRRARLWRQPNAFADGARAPSTEAHDGSWASASGPKAACPELLPWSPLQTHVRCPRVMSAPGAEATSHGFLPCKPLSQFFTPWNRMGRRGVWHCPG